VSGPIRGNAAKRRKLRCQLFQQAGGDCALCGRPMHWFDFTIDHKMPRVHGGGHDFDNLQAAHRMCNWRKSDTIQPTHWAPLPEGPK
jgi:5-methylcytosine-specific restriction endonuclease McrA